MKSTTDFANFNHKQWQTLQQAPRKASALLKQRSKYYDAILKQLYKQTLAKYRFTLIATGSYGRSRLYRYSDVDLLILTNDSAQPLSDSAKQAISSFLAQAWDLKLEMRHSIRCLSDCCADAVEDNVFFTSLLEARLIIGDNQQFRKLQRRVYSNTLWPLQAFYNAKKQETDARYHQFQDTIYKLEPDLKNGPGGLRDIDTVRWLLQHHYGATDLTALYKKKHLTAQEYRKIRSAENFLAQLRLGLHFIAENRQNCLLFDHQIKLAELLGFNEASSNQSVAAMMRCYFHHAANIRLLFTILMRQFEQSFTRSKSRRIANTPFITTGSYLGLAPKVNLKKQPELLFELFLYLSQQEQLQGLDVPTSQAILKNRHLINKRFRDNKQHHALFINLLRQPTVLRMMNRFGLVGAYLPCFARIVGQTQFSLFHSYSVDTHTLFVMQNIEAYLKTSLEQAKQNKQHYAMVCHELKDLQVIYTAAFFHDIAKGRPGDHSTLGAEEAKHFCQTHAYSPYQTRLIHWLVLNHLILSKTAQEKDIQDANVINEFAKQIGDITRLNYLYVLTVADIQGTNSKLWNSWKETLLKSLYLATYDTLEQGIRQDTVSNQEQINQAQAEAKTLLTPNQFDDATITRLWHSWPQDYFIKNDTDTIAKQTEIILRSANTYPVIEIYDSIQAPATANLLLYCDNHHHLFTHVVNALDRLNISINAAMLSSSDNGLSLQHYVIFEQNNKVPQNPERLQEIKTAVQAAIKQTALPKLVRRRANLKLSPFKVPTEVSFSTLPANMTALRLITRDQPSLLAYISLTLSRYDMIIHTAKISTFGERVEDILYITDASLHAITNSALQTKIKQTLCERFDRTQSLKNHN